jgi:hypothetical protein
VRVENGIQRVFDIRSPVSLTRAGREILRCSGLKSYIDTHASSWLNRAPLGDPYRLQAWAFRLLADMDFEARVNARINAFAFTHGMTTDLIRRIGGIYLRDLASTRRNARRITARRKGSPRPLDVV